MTTKTSKLVLETSKAFLEMAELGLRDLLSDDSTYRDLGLRNLAMHGGNVLFAMQDLSDTEPGFDEWYTGIYTEIESSELYCFFVEMSKEYDNKESLHSGKNNNSADFTIDLFNRMAKPLVANVIGFFISDYLGGYGWDIQLPDREREKFYLSLPEELITIEKPQFPTDHLGLSIEGKTIQELSQLYFDYLTDIVDRASKKFN